MIAVSLSHRALAAATFFLIAPAWAAFTDNGDGTITDTVTGLMWDKCTWGQSGNTCTGGAASTQDWPQALAVAGTANAGNHKGRNDWRLPNGNELESITKLDAVNPAIDTIAFPNTPSSWFWSSTTYSLLPAYAWVVFFSDGSPDVNYKTGTYYVRLVRSGQSFGSYDSLAPAVATTPTSIPTLSEWGMLLLSGLMGLMGWRGMRRRNPVH